MPQNCFYFFHILFSTKKKALQTKHNIVFSFLHLVSKTFCLRYIFFPHWPMIINCYCFIVIGIILCCFYFFAPNFEQKLCQRLVATKWLFFVDRIEMVLNCFKFVSFKLFKIQKMRIFHE